jgi:ferredoxin
MNIRVDREKCTGHGRCYVLAPEVYGADDEGYCVLLQADVPADQQDIATRAALNCPEDAITILNQEN